MLSNFCKVIFRTLLRSRFYFFLNVAGLSIGIACAIVIYLFVRNELSYDKFHANGDNIYRVIRKSQINGMPYNIGITSGNFASAIAEEYPNHISATTRAFPFSDIVEYEGKTFMEDHLLLADSSFFTFFSYPLLKGDNASVLASANGLVITKSFARKYFGDEEPLGKQLRVSDTYDVVVTGVMDDLPGNTHLTFDAVLSLSLLEKEEWFHDWWNNCLHTYVVVNDKESVDFLNKAFSSFMEKFFGKDFQRIGNRIDLVLEPLKEIYFNFDTRYETNTAHGDRRYVYAFSTIGFVLLFLAAVNYVNLCTAQAARRMKEVGVRKTLGSSRSTIAWQFLGESFFLCSLSMLLALAIAQLAVPVLNSSLGTKLPDVSSDGSLAVFLPVLLIILSVAAGAYPALLLARFKPVKTLKGNLEIGGGHLFSFRKVLIVGQFSISTFMIIATLFISQQIKFMHEKDLGFESEHLVLVRLNNLEAYRNAVTLKQRIAELPEVAQASITSGFPGGFYDASTIQIEGHESNIRMRTLWCDADLQKTMNIPIVAGRFFSEEIPYDTLGSVLLNETAVKQLGITPAEALGRRIKIAQFDSTFREVVGVVADYHFTSLKEKIEPLIIANRNREGFLIVKAKANSLDATIQKIEVIWNSYETGFPAEVRILDDVIGRIYTAENVQGKIFTSFSFISVIIACIGIFGLAAFMSAQRRKEVSIRKVLGATFGQLSFLLSVDLLKLVVVANVITIPVVYWAINEWSAAFPYKAPLSPVIFIIGALSILTLSAIVVLMNTTKAAVENPSSSLRSD